MADFDTAATAIGYVGDFMSFIVYLAPLFTFHKIRKGNSTKGHTYAPFIVAFFSSGLWLYYGLLGKTKPIIYINAFGLAIEFLYISVYTYYSPVDKRIKIGKIFGIGFVIVCLTIVVTYITFQHDLRLLIKVVGWIGTFVSLVVFASPIKIVVKVFRIKKNEFIPIELIGCSAITVLVWLGYGILKREIVMMISNSLGFIICALQMFVWWAFRKAQVPSLPTTRVA